MATGDVDATHDELADAYASLRRRCLDLGRSLDDVQAGTMSPCCPAWSVKDLYAHFAGVASDILAGNTEGAATEAWADAQVERRRDASLAEICDEWEADGAQVDEVVRGFGDAFPPQFYLDAWTHEWDVRQALGVAAEPDLTLLRAVRPFLARRLHERANEMASTHSGEPFELVVSDGVDTWRSNVGDGDATSTVELSTVELSLFEFGRITMGRRSAAQIDEVRPGADPALLVFWSVNDEAIVDPVLD